MLVISSQESSLGPSLRADVVCPLSDESGGPVRKTRARDRVAQSRSQLGHGYQGYHHNCIPV